MAPSGLSIWTSMPVSSRVSRSAVSSMDSPLSGYPWKRPEHGDSAVDQEDLYAFPFGPMDDAPGSTSARIAQGATPLGAADARRAEQCPLAARANAADAADRREAESARQRAQRGDGRDRLAQTTRAVVDRVSGP